MPADQDVVYATAGETKLRLDVLRPVQGSARTAVILLHGDNWRAGDKRDMHLVGRSLADRGFVALPTQYRLTGQAPWPAQIQDVKAAICWTRANADQLEIEPDRIVLYGVSAGGHLALLAAGTPNHPTFDPRGGVSSAVAAVVAIHPPTTLYMSGERPPHASGASALLGKAATLTRARTASPTTYVNKAFPPTLLLHGTRDQVVHHAASQWMFDALSAVDVPADLHLFHGHDHGFAALPSMAPLIEAEVALFLDRTVVAPARHQDEVDRQGLFSRPPQAANQA